MPLKGTIYSVADIAELRGQSMRHTRKLIHDAIEDGTLNEFYYMKIGQGYALTSTGVKKVFGKTATEMQLKKMYDKE